MGERKKLWHPLKKTKDFENAYFPEVREQEHGAYIIRTHTLISAK